MQPLMGTEDRTVQLADGRGTAEVMQGDRCVLVSTKAPLILDPSQARRLADLLRTAADRSEQAR